MERSAGFAIEPGSAPTGSLFHRFIAFLGAALFGIGVERGNATPRKWWEEEPPPPPPPVKPMRVGHQAVFSGFGDRELILDAPVTLAPNATPPPAHNITPTPFDGTAVLSAGRGGMVETIVSPLTSHSSAKRVATTKRAAANAPAIPITAVPRQTTAEGAIGRQLLLSQSLYYSSGSEEPRRYSVPRRALLPRFQLFAGGDGVISDGRGHFSIPHRGPKSQRGRVWFV